jgi:hypothetical protein
MGGPRAGTDVAQVELTGRGGGAVTFCWAETDSGETPN